MGMWERYCLEKSEFLHILHLSEKMTMSEKYHVDDEGIGKHLEDSSGDQGACLSRHVNPFNKDNSCSHRWQGLRAAKKDKKLYNWPRYKKFTIVELGASDDDKSRTVVRHGQKFRKKDGGLRTLPKLEIPPGKNRWDIGQSNSIVRSEGGSAKTITAENFTERCEIPYFHNSHHIIPNGVFNECLREFANFEETLLVYIYMRKGLLEAKYNINHKKNMFILPMSRIIAKAIRLPRHISGVEGLESESDPIESTDHDQYNTKIKAKINDVIESYASDIDEQAHTVELGEFSKAQLEEISEEIRKTLISWGGSEGEGASTRHEGHDINQAPI